VEKLNTALPNDIAVQPWKKGLRSTMEDGTRPLTNPRRLILHQYDAAPRPLAFSKKLKQELPSSSRPGAIIYSSSSGSSSSRGNPSLRQRGGT